jgi:rfaE bifunctional protein nucleotidyltransferase chain/domain
MSKINEVTVERILSGNLNFQDRYVPKYDDLEQLLKLLRQYGRKIVLTQGVYDMFHVGHGRYLSEAKRHGDILIVGIDTDELTRKRKGPDRPFDTLSHRVEVLAMLRAVDIITIRDVHHHMYDLIKLVKPDVLIMSETTEDFGDKDRQKLLRYCGELKVLEAKAATTTTAKLRRIMNTGARGLSEKISAVVTDYLKQLEVKNER